MDEIWMIYGWLYWWSMDDHMDSILIVSWYYYINSNNFNTDRKQQKQQHHHHHHHSNNKHNTLKEAYAQREWERNNTTQWLCGHRLVIILLLDYCDVFVSLLLYDSWLFLMIFWSFWWFCDAFAVVVRSNTTIQWSKTMI